MIRDPHDAQIAAETINEAADILRRAEGGLDLLYIHYINTEHRQLAIDAHRSAFHYMRARLLITGSPIA